MKKVSINQMGATPIIAQGQCSVNGEYSFHGGNETHTVHEEHKVFLEGRAGKA